MTGPALLARIDAAIAELYAIRAEVAALSCDTTPIEGISRRRGRADLCSIRAASSRMFIAFRQPRAAPAWS
jgi:hypothetical protein